MTYKLYNRTGSGGFSVEAALAVGGLAYAVVDVASTPNTPLPEAFRDVNPWRQVPVLVLPDGTVMTESAAILVHLVAAHPAANLGPTPGSTGSARLLRWLFFMTANVYEGILRVSYPDRFTTDPAGHPAVVAAARQRTHQAFQVLEAEIARDGWLLGDRLTVGDIQLAMLYAWHIATDDCPECARITNQVAAHPVIAPIWQRNFDHRLRKKWGRST